MDWSAVGALVGPMAPTIGGLLGGLIPFPGGAVLGEVAGKMLGEALGVPPTPAAISTAITTGDPVTVQAALTSADTKMNSEVEKLRLDILDVQDARKTGLEYDSRGSSIKWAPAIVSTIAVFGFVAISYLVLGKQTGVDRDVMMYLLGIWSAAFTTVLNFWLGSSSGSQDKSDKLAALNPVLALKKK